MINKLLIAGLVGLTTSICALAESPKFIIGDTWIHFRVDDTDKELPSEVILQLARSATGASTETLSSELVHALGSTQRYRDIIIERVQGKENKIHILASARTAWTIESIQFKNPRNSPENSSQLQTMIESRTDQPVLGLQSIDIDSLRIENSLKRQGFLKAKVRYFVKEKSKGKLDITFIIDRGNPCLIADFLPLAEPLRIFRYISSGDRCNRDSIANQIREEESRLRNQGFINARLQFNPETDLIPTTDRERATLRYKYLAGEKWSLQIVDRANGSSVEEDFMRKTGFVLGDLAFSNANDIQAQVEIYFREQGYADVVVNPSEINNPAANEKRLRFEVDKGPSLFVEHNSTEFVGDLAIPTKEAIETLGIVPGFFDLGSGVPYIESELESKGKVLQDYLANKGYLDAKVGTLQSTRTVGSDKLRLRVPVKSGKRYVIKKVILEGKPVGLDTSGLLEEFLPEGQSLQASQLARFESVLQNELQMNGWRTGKVQMPLSKCTGDDKDSRALLLCTPNDDSTIAAEIIVKIDAGPVFRIGKISAGDIPFEKAEAVLDAAGLMSGDILSSRQLANARDRILKHGLFGSVTFQGADTLAISDVERKDAAIFRDIVITATRPRNWNLTLNPSWSSDRGYGFQTDFRRNNISSDGLQFFVQSTITQEPYQNTSSNGIAAGQVPGVSVSTGLREAFFRAGPWVTPFDFNYVTIGEEIDVRAERRETTRIQSDIAWRPYWFGMEFTHKLETSYSLSAYPLGGVSQPVKIIDRSNNVGALEVSASTALDTRNNPIWPRKGWILSLGVSHSNTKLGSDVDYDKFSGDYSQYFALSRNLTQSFSILGRHITSVDSPGARREKISSLQVRGFPAIDTSLGPLLWYLETDNRGNCTAKLTQAAATNLFSGRTETRWRSAHSNWATVLFYDAASSYFSRGQVDTLNTRLRNSSNDTNSACPQSAARVIGNDAVDLDLLQGGFFGDFARTSYQSAGLGLRFFLADMFALHVDWGFPTHDPSDGNPSCKPFSSPYGEARAPGVAPTPPSCISRRPSYFQEWNSTRNVLQNSFNFLLRTQISIEGKF